MITGDSYINSKGVQSVKLVTVADN